MYVSVRLKAILLMCVVLRAAASITTSAWLRDDWSVVKSTLEPNFTSPIHNVTVAAGKEAILTCNVSNLGKYKVAWVRAEDQTILSLHTRVVTHNSRVGVAHDGLETWRLRIRPVKESDRGCYLCQINTSQLKTQKGCIDVFVPPDIINEETSSDMSVLEGENTTLVCKAAGHPIPRITWRREDGNPILIRKGIREYTKVETYNGSSLHFWRLDRKDMGAYLCIASNDIPPAVSKRISLSVHFAPLIKVPNQLLGAPLETDVQLECYVEAYPNTINYWVKNRSEMLLNGSKYAIREEKSGYRVYMWLLIRSFSPADIGTYNCVSTNSLGKAEGTLRLYGSLYLAKLGNQTKNFQNPLGTSQNIYSEEYKKEESEHAENDFIQTLCSNIHGEKPSQCYKSPASKEWPLLELLSHVTLTAAVAYWTTADPF